MVFYSVKKKGKTLVYLFIKKEILFARDIITSTLIPGSLFLRLRFVN